MAFIDVKNVVQQFFIPFFEHIRQFIVSPEYREMRRDQNKKRVMVKECVQRAARCYRVMTGYRVPNPVSFTELEGIIFTSSTSEDILINLKSSSHSNDPQFILLLYIAIRNVYTTNTPPWLGASGSSAFALPQ